MSATTMNLATDKRIEWPAGVNEAPDGWSWGAHVSLGARGDGYYLIRESDGATLIAVQRVDLGADDAPTDDDLATALAGES